VTADGRVVVVDSGDGTTVVDLPLDLVLGKMPQKEFPMVRQSPVLEPLVLPEGLTVEAALDRVLRLLAVGSKRFLTNKVDRSVTGLVAQQQCVGPLHTPLANVAVIAQSHFGITGVAHTTGEQPIKVSRPPPRPLIPSCGVVWSLCLLLPHPHTHVAWTATALMCCVCVCRA
jgi:phosphoribosylformylglycinamidine synthase